MKKENLAEEISSVGRGCEEVKSVVDHQNMKVHSLHSKRQLPARGVLLLLES